MLVTFKFVLICLFEFSNLDLIVVELMLLSEDADEAVTVKSLDLNEPVVVSAFFVGTAAVVEIVGLKIDGISGSSKLS